MPTLTPITDGHKLGRTREDYTGKRFGFLVAVREAGRDQNKKIYWEFRCDCGATHIAQHASVVKYEGSSCGCQYRRAPGESAGHNRYILYRNEARKRGLPFELTEAQFLVLAKQSCHYCGVAPMQVHAPLNAKGRPNYHGEFVYNGIDRVDNDLGYFWENCVPCCGVCNEAKRGKPHSQFVAWLARIAGFRSGSQ